jgi:hypothetical protein
MSIQTNNWALHEVPAAWRTRCPQALGGSPEFRGSTPGAVETLAQLPKKRSHVRKFIALRARCSIFFAALIRNVVLF